MTLLHQLASPIVLVALVVTVGYIAACAIWPFRACRRCAGAGKRRSPSGRAFRHCRHCNGTGARARIGRLVWSWLRDTHDRGTRHTERRSNR
ncbi:MAG: hypothetical protein ACRDMV_14365 [Streptosporangiales bacterium]